MKNNKAVTLVALIITIIILLILAGVVIAMTVGGEGIINKSMQAVDKYNEASVREKVTIMLAEYAMERTSSTKTLEEYLNEQKTKGELDEVTNNGDGTITVELDGYEVTIKESDLSIVEIGKTGGVRPEILISQSESNGNKVKITVFVTNATIENFSDLVIEMKNETNEDITGVKTKEGALETSAEFEITMNGKYIVKAIGTSRKDLIIKDRTKNIDVIIENNAPDDLAPDYILGTNKITAVLKQTDQESGIDVSKTKYRIRTEEGTFGEWQESPVFEGLTEKNYYLQSQATDNVGNMAESQEKVVNMWNGTLTMKNGVEVATHSGGVFNTIYESSFSSICLGTGTKIYDKDHWGDYGGTYERNCPTCNKRLTRMDLGGRFSLLCLPFTY